MSDLPLGYHITFGTYGTRLLGDQRGTVLREVNSAGEEIIGRDVHWERFERQRLNFAPVLFDVEKREYIESMLPIICEKGNWTLMNVAAQRDHVHVLLSAYADGKVVRKWLKRWLGEALTSRFSDALTRRTGRNPDTKLSWWSEGGSVRWVWNEKYLATVDEYIEAQRTTKRT